MTTTRQIDDTLLQHAPPRSLPPWLIADLIGDKLADRPLISYFDPLLVSGVMAALALVLLHAPLWLSWLVALLMAVRLGSIVWDLLNDAWEDMRLLRHGMIVQARVLRVRQCRITSGDLCGAYLDCALPISPHRTSVGSVWFADAEEAIHLAQGGRVQALCLPRAPGTWRLLEEGELVMGDRQ